MKHIFCTVVNQVPHLQGLIKRCRTPQAAITTERHGADIVMIACHPQKTLPRIQIPVFEVAVQTPQQSALPVITHSQYTGLVRSDGYSSDARTALDVPYFERPISRCREYLLSIRYGMLPV